MTTLAEALAPKSDQLNAADLMTGPRTIKITGARILKEGPATKVVISFEGDNGKPWKPCKTMGRAMVNWSVTDESQFVGKSVRVYRDPTVTFGADGEIGGIRVSHMSHIEKPAVMKLMVSKGKYQLFTFQPLPTAVPREVADELTAEAAEHSLRTAATLDDLKAVWANKSMRPFREKLQPVLDERKAELTPANTDAADIAKLYADATTPADLSTADMAANKLGLSENLTVQAARSDARDAIGGEA